MARDYTSLITSSHADKPKFVAMVSLTAGALGAAGDAAVSLASAFDVDTAVGPQLDAVGLWVGIGRGLPVPLPNIYFSMDSETLGFDAGYFQGPYDSTQGLTKLDDSTYRVLLKAKIAANFWDGTNKQHQSLATNALASLGLSLAPIDNQDMSYDVIVLGTQAPVILGLVKRNIIPPKPAGVAINNYLYGRAPFFAFDQPTGSLLAGFDAGSFATPF